MSDYEDYDNLAFAPRGNTDRTQSTIELVEMYEKLKAENKKLKERLEKAIITLQALGVTVTTDMELDK